MEKVLRDEHARLQVRWEDGHTSILAGRLNISACEGVVVLVRGLVDEPAAVRWIVDRVLEVRGVRGVENLMHVPGTAAPHQDGVVSMHAHRAAL